MQNIPFLSSKASVKKALSKGQIELNGRKPRYFVKVQVGDKLKVMREERRAPKPKFEERLIPIVYKDDHCVIVNKPGGIAVNGNRHKTVENVMQHVVRKSKLNDALPYAMPVHRLDVPTAGLVIMARTRSFQIGMGKALEDKNVQKKYVAIVHGKLEGNGAVKKPLDGKNCVSLYRSLAIVPSINFGHMTMVELEPVTGRTHQLRKHMQMIGHPIAGDKMYNNSEYKLQGKGMLLCAVSLSFKHPVSHKPVSVDVPPPEKFERVLKREEEFYRRKGTS